MTPEESRRIAVTAARYCRENGMSWREFEYAAKHEREQFEQDDVRTALTEVVDRNELVHILHCVFTPTKR